MVISVKWLKRQLGFGALLLTVGVVCFTLANSLWAMLGAQWNLERVSYRAADAIELSRMRDIRRQFELSGGEGTATAWGQSLNRRIENKAVGENLSIDVIWVDGDAREIMNPRMLRGELPMLHERISCALDEETALKLFGSLDILGRVVVIGGAEMEVCGVYAFPPAAALGQPGRGLAFAPAALMGAGDALTALEMTIWFDAGGKAPEEIARELMGAAGIGTGGDFTTYSDLRSGMALLTGLAENLLALLIILELLNILVKMTRASLRRGVVLKNDRLRENTGAWTIAGAWLLRFLLIIGAAAFTLTQTRIQGAIPPSYLPTRWSDFAFWPDLLNSIFTGYANARLAASLRPDMLFEAILALCGALCVASLFLILWGRRALGRGLEQASLARAALWSIPVLISLPVGLWLADRFALPLTLPGGVILPIAFYGLFALARRAVYPLFEREGEGIQSTTSKRRFQLPKLVDKKKDLKGRFDS